MGNKNSVKGKDQPGEQLAMTPIPNPGLDVLRQKNFPFENVVFEGGDNKLLAYCGAVQVLEEIGLWKRIARLAGSGKGAVIAALLSVDFKSDQLVTLFEDDLQSILAGSKSGKKVSKWIRTKLKEKTGKADITFEEVYDRFRKDVCIVLTSVDRRTADYCHVKTTPDMSVATAVCLSLGFVPANYKPKYCSGNQEIQTNGLLVANYPIHCYDGWWLSMKPENSFLNKIQNLDDLPKINSRRNRFGDFNKATIGLAVFDDSTMNNFLISLPTGVKGTSYETPLHKNKTSLVSEVTSRRENYCRLMTSLNKLVRLAKEKKSGQNDLLGKQDISDIIEKGAITEEELQIIFETKPNVDEIFEQIANGKKTEITIEDLLKFSERKRIKFHVQCFHDRFSSIKTPDQLWNAVRILIQENNFLLNTRKIDSRRTVAINTGWVYRSDPGNKLEEHDRKYLIEQGQLAMRIFLEKFDSSALTDKGFIQQTELGFENDAKRKSEIYSNDFKQFIDDDIPEIIDERDYMDTYFEKVL